MIKWLFLHVVRMGMFAGDQILFPSGQLCMLACNQVMLADGQMGKPACDQVMVRGDQMCMLASDTGRWSDGYACI